jgi:hypothetical protein
MALQSAEYLQSLSSVVSAYALVGEVRELITSLSNLLSLAFQYDRLGDRDFVEGMQVGVSALQDDGERVYDLSELCEEVNRCISYEEWTFHNRFCTAMYCTPLYPYSWSVGFTLSYTALLIASGRTPLEVTVC